jgi:hypothetical protein
LFYIAMAMLVWSLWREFRPKRRQITESASNA